jgi:hypothetical protein
MTAIDMATAEQKIFKKIVLHNKLLNEASVDRLLLQLSDPEVAVKYLVKREKLTAKKAGQLLKLYHKQLEKHLGKGSASHVLAEKEAKRPLSADESFDAMLDEIVSGVAAVPATKETKAETPSATSVERVYADPQEGTGTAVEPQPVETPLPAAITPSGAEAGDRLSVDVEDDLEEDTSAADTGTMGGTPSLKVTEQEELPLLELDTDDDDEG